MRVKLEGEVTTKGPIKNVIKCKVLYPGGFKNISAVSEFTSFPHPKRR